ncbi:MAG: hypothetical protein U9N84_14560 [Actinomycetota bacterium]|nr:hypothetical protein [Actinomycetota bacterium]
MRRALSLLVPMVLIVAACTGDEGGETATSTAPPTTAPSLASTTASPTTTPGPSSTTTTTSPATSTSIDATSPPPTTGDAVALAQARLDALWSADPANPYGALEIRCPDADRPIAIGDVLMCQGLDRSPAASDIHNLAFLVLDDDGATSMLTRGDLADLAAAYSEAPHGLFCRDLLTGEAPGPFDLTFTTYDIPDFDTAAFLATAYWFLEGRRIAWTPTAMESHVRPCCRRSRSPGCGTVAFSPADTKNV